VQLSRWVLVLFVVAVCMGSGEGLAAETAPPETLRIENELLAVEFGVKDSTFVVTAKGAGLRFIERGTLAGHGGRRIKGRCSSWRQD